MDFHIFFFNSNINFPDNKICYDCISWGEIPRSFALNNQQIQLELLWYLVSSVAGQFIFCCRNFIPFNLYFINYGFCGDKWDNWDVPELGSSVVQKAFNIYLLAATTSAFGIASGAVLFVVANPSYSIVNEQTELYYLRNFNNKNPYP